uniref:G_PROTEIN_RECEP_F1_2 domain-containing protein n=1 Tax=Mesocestoides corti TaxID=53468 RepID=A0A5K3ENA9_MESCO
MHNTSLAPGEFKTLNATHTETVEIFDLGTKLGMSFPYIPLMIISLIGNSLVCYVIQRYLQNSVTNIFLFNLSITDILTTLAVIPMTAIADIWLNHWPFGAAMCKLVPFIQCITVTLTAFTHVLISCDRFLIVFRPLQRRRLLTPRRARFLIILLWVTACIQATPLAVVGYLPEGPNARCAESWDAHRSQAYTTTLMVMQYFIPLTLLICSYSVICWKLNSTQGRGPVSASRSRMTVRSKRKMVKMMIAVSALYAVSQLPRHVIYLYGTVVNWASKDLAIAWMFVVLLSSSASCYNPFIYAWMNQTYRIGFTRVLCCCCVKWKNKNQPEGRIKNRSTDEF